MLHLLLDSAENLEAVLSAIFHKNVKLNLTPGTIFDEVLDNDYTFTIMYNNNETLNISINNSQSYDILYTDLNYNDYADFSVVSDKLKNQTE